MRGRRNVHLRNLTESLIYLLNCILIRKISGQFHHHVPCISPKMALRFNVSFHANLWRGQSDLGL